MQKLLATSSVTALVANRIWWDKAPQSETGMPAIVLGNPSSDRLVTLSGSDGLVDALVDFNCYGRSLASSLAVKRAIVAELEGASFEQDGVRFQGCFVETERHADPDIDPTLSRQAITMRIWHRPN